jgi:hypothetical protein
MDQEKINRIIERTRLLHEEVASHFSRITPAEGARNFIAFRAALLSFEFAAGSLLLNSHDLSAPAYALLRSQYESLVRGIWLLHSASEAWVEKLANPLTRENADRANEGLGLSEMLKQLENGLTSPKPIVAQLREYKEVSWKAMSSYTHGGLHPLSRTMTGFPAQLSVNVIRNSNAIVHLTCQLGAILTGDQRSMDRVRKLTIDYADCLPIRSAA